MNFSNAIFFVSGGITFVFLSLFLVRICVVKSRKMMANQTLITPTRWQSAAHVCRETDGTLRVNAEKKNTLCLFHGTEYCSDFFINKYHNIFSIDEKPEMKPTIVGRVENPETFQEIPDESMDLVLLFSCRLYTSSVFTSEENLRNIMVQVKRVLKPEGELRIRHLSDIPTRYLSSADILQFGDLEEEPEKDENDFSIFRKKKNSYPPLYRLVSKGEMDHYMNT